MNQRSRCDIVFVLQNTTLPEERLLTVFDGPGGGMRRPGRVSSVIVRGLKERREALTISPNTVSI
jgi:hypothetical protein